MTILEGALVLVAVLYAVKLGVELYDHLKYRVYYLFKPDPSPCLNTSQFNIMPTPVLTGSVKKQTKRKKK